MNMVAASDSDTGRLAAFVAQGQWQEASTLADTILVRESANAVAWYAKGMSSRNLGDKANAVTYFNNALKCKPDYVEACAELALTLEESSQLLMALKLYEYLQKIAPGHKAVGRLIALRSSKIAGQQLDEWFARGNQYLAQGQDDAAMAAYQNALAIRPDTPEVLANMGLLLYRNQRLNEAEQVLRLCLQHRPAYPEVLNSLGNVYKDMNRHDAAISAYREALAANPGYLSAWVNLGKILQEFEHHAAAIEAYEHALRINPHHVAVLAELLHRRNHLCRWDGQDNLLADLEQAINSGKQSALPFVVALYASPYTQYTNAMRWAQEHFPSGKAYNPAQPLPTAARGDGKLRIGYLSADYHRNATAFLISELFERHNRDQFEILAYSCGPDDSSNERKRIVDAVDSFRDLRGVSDQQAAALIQQDGIDVLVDLKGYTHNHRLGLMALRPAPVQIHYLGYPGTTGACFIDYFISDSVASPEGADNVFSEQLIRLPYSYQINDHNRPLPNNTFSRKDYGLPEAAFVFCDFNQSYKITRDVFEVWLRLLSQVEGSVLWLFETSPEATENLKREASLHGITPERIVVATVAAPDMHLARYQHADLCLDTYPVCGHTTASDALWCGVPVITLAGESFASRVAASLLQAVGLGELVMDNIADYEALALDLTRDKDRLQRLRHHLTSQRMQLPLFDTSHTTRSLEAAYQHAVTCHREGKSPQAFNITETFAVTNHLKDNRTNL